VQPVFSQSVAYGKRWTRAACGVALAKAAAQAVQGCTSAPASGGTGGGQAAPAVTAAEASQAWESYRAAVAQAASAGDEASYLASLTGAAYVTHSTALKVAGASRLRLLAGGNYRYGTPTFYLPEPAGYPRWFVADVNTMQAGPSQPALTPAEGAPVPWAAPGHGRLLYLFEKASATAPWQLASESALAPGVALPALAADGSGHVPAQVPDTALLAPAGVAGPLQAAVVDDGPASSAAKVVASGPLTTGLYATMRSTLLGLSVPAGDVSQWELEGSNYQRFALRTADGGALVLYAMYLNTAVEVPAVLNKAQPVNPGPPITVPAYVMPLLPPGKTTPRKTLATQQLLSFAAVDPPAGNGKIAVIAIGGGLSYASASLPGGAGQRARRDQRPDHAGRDGQRGEREPFALPDLAERPGRTLHGRGVPRLPGSDPLARHAVPADGEHVPGQRGVRAVQLVPQGRSRHGRPAVFARQRHDQVAEPADLQPVGDREVDRGRFLHAAAGHGSAGHDVEGGVGRDHRRHLIGQRGRYPAGGEGRAPLLVARQVPPGQQFRYGRTDGRDSRGEEADCLRDAERCPAVHEQPASSPLHQLASLEDQGDPGVYLDLAGQLLDLAPERGHTEDLAGDQPGARDVRH